MSGSAQVIAALGAGAVAAESFGQLTIDVPAARWLASARTLHDEFGFGFFDWLSAYDDGDAGLAVVVHVWSVAGRQSVKLRTRVARDGGSLPSLSDVWPGANWHERETFEMFAVTFDGHPRLVPLLLPDGFDGHPLRKEFVLASRVARSWPGEKEPGESARDVEPRRRLQPPGVPAPGEWGPPR